MPSPWALITGSHITAQEFFEVLHASGGIIENVAACEGRISRGANHVWVSLDNRLLQELDPDIHMLMHQKLPDKPHSHILLDMSKTDGSEQLALEFITICVERWPCVVYDYQATVLRGEDWLRLHPVGVGFPV